MVLNIQKFPHITPFPPFLRWLPVAACIRIKMIAYKIKNGPILTYMKALIRARLSNNQMTKSNNQNVFYKIKLA